MQAVSGLTSLSGSQRGKRYKLYRRWVWLTVLEGSGGRRAEWDVLVSVAASGCNLVWKLIQLILKSGLEESKGCRPYAFLCASLLCLVAYVVAYVVKN